MYPYVLKLTFGNTQARNDASNIQTQRQLYQSSMDNNDILQEFLRPSLAEFFGSLLFVLLSALLGFATVNSQLSTSIYEGAIVFVLMSMLARISGGHFNPAITISVLFCGQCRITLGICIVFMQLFGSFIGAMLMRTLILEAAYIDIFRGSIIDESDATLVNRIQAFLLEMLLSFLISSTYLFTSIDTKGNNGMFCSAAVSVARVNHCFILFRVACIIYWLSPIGSMCKYSAIGCNIGCSFDLLL
uniref:Aquaporin n=1 Tax=Parascaris univalens TaxID=6257 RepID=A0A915CK56_PARUN